MHNIKIKKESVLVLHALVDLRVTLVDGQVVLVGPAVGQLAAGVETECFHVDSHAPTDKLNAFYQLG